MIHSQLITTLIVTHAYLIHFLMLAIPDPSPSFVWYNNTDESFFTTLAFFMGFQSRHLLRPPRCLPYHPRNSQHSVQ